MRYAIISDIHGNIDAFKAVIDDMRKKDITNIIISGDIAGDFPYLNVVIDLLKDMDDILIIKGNRDDYVLDLTEEELIAKEFEHLNPLCWIRENISGENFEFLSALPSTLKPTINSKKISITHSLEEIIKHKKLMNLSSSNFAIYYENKSKEDYNKDLIDLIENSQDIIEEVSNLEDDIFIFGHSHLQWNIKIKNKWFINAGSCGMPLDGNTSAPYTILNMDDEITVEQVRVHYDINEITLKLKNSEIYETSPYWFDLVINHLHTATETISFFFSYAIEQNKGRFPIEDKVWRSSYDKFINNELEQVYKKKADA